MRQAGARPVLISDAASVQPTAEEGWAELFGTAAPTRTPMLIEQALGWKKQVLQHGDIAAPVRRDLNVALGNMRSGRAKRSLGPFEQHALCAGTGDGADNSDSLLGDGSAALPTASSQLLVGARLLKAYGGRSHVVEVTADGMLYEGQLFGSLSAVAKAITGTHWNGLLFFGLRKRRTYPAKPASNG